MADIELDMQSLRASSAYRFLVGAVQPRPIAWVTTVDASGARNLAPFSFFTVASRRPPTILLSISCDDEGGRKDTLENIVDTGEFVVNVPSDRHRDAVERSSTPSASHVDEISRLDLSTVPSRTVAPPRLEDAHIALECRLERTVAIGTDTVVFGTVLWVHADETVADAEGHVSHDALQPLGRLAGPWYTSPLMRTRPTLDVAHD